MNQRMRIHLLLIVFSCIINVVFSIWRSVPIPTTNVDWVSGTWVSSMVAFLVGKTTISGVILQSINGGSNWTESFSGTDPFYDINSVTISGKVYIVAVCSSGAIYYSSNTIANVANSYSWTKVSVTSGSLYGVALGITGNIVAVGFQSSQPGLSLVYKSSVSTLTSWTPAPPGLVVQLNGIGTADGNNFLIVGDVGTILYFQYSTSFFTPQTSPTTVQLYDISVLPNSNIAVACGASATVLTTSTLGAKWTSVNVAGVGLVASSTNFYYHPIAILNAQDVYLASSTGDILISQNAGGKWTTAVSPALAYPLLALAAYTINLVVVGSGRSSVTLPATSAVYIKGPGTNDFTNLPTGQPTSVPTGFLQPNINWFQFNLKSSSYFIYSSVWSTASNVVLVGNDVTNTGIILHSTNAGVSFTLISSSQYKTQGQTIPPFTSVASRQYVINNAIQYYHIAVATSGVVVISTNNGYNWTLAVNLAATLSSVTLGRNGFAYIAGQYSTGQAAVFISVAAFVYNSWSDISPSNNGLVIGARINAIRTFDGKRLIAVGNKGLIITCPNGLATPPSWYLQQNNTSYDLYSLSGSTSKTAIVGGTNLSMLQTNNAGLNWTIVSSISKLGLPPTASFVYSTIYQVTNAVIYAAVSNGAILRSTSGGKSWVNETTLAYGVSPLTSLSFYQTVTGIAVSDAGVVYVQVHQAPSGQPTRQPSRQPTGQPSRRPSGQPTTQPSGRPSRIPFSIIPSSFPSRPPVIPPTSQPSSQPSLMPTSFPTAYYDLIVQVTVQQSFLGVNTMFLNTAAARTDFSDVILSFFSVQNRWIRVVIGNTTSYFQNAPTSMPSGHPSARPTTAVQRRAPHFPTSQPTSGPSHCPTRQPSRQPSSHPTSQPIRHPLARPTSRPSSQPSGVLRRQLREEPSYGGSFMRFSGFTFGLDVTATAVAGSSGATVTYIVGVVIPASGFHNVSSAYNFIVNSLNSAVKSSVCTTSMQEAFAGTSASSIVCQPFITTGAAVIVPIHNSPAPSKAPSVTDYIGKLSRTSFIILMVFMCLIFLCCVGAIGYFVLPMCGVDDMCGCCVGMFAACCGGIFAILCCCCRRRRIDDDDDEDRNYTQQKSKKVESTWNKKKQEEEEEEEEDDDDDDDDDDNGKKKKKGWFSSLFGKKKKKNDDDDDDDDDDEEEDDDEDDKHKSKNASRYDTVRTSGTRSR